MRPFFVALFAAALVGRAARRAWPLLVVLAFFGLMAAWAPLHRLAVEFLGFGFSRGNPIPGC